MSTFGHITFASRNVSGKTFVLLCGVLVLALGYHFSQLLSKYLDLAYMKW